MANLLDYIDWRGDITFGNNHINQVDVLAFSQLALLDLDDIVPGVENDNGITIKEAFDSLVEKGRDICKDLGLIIPNHMFPMMKKMSLSKRYKNIVLKKYVNDVNVERQTQFCAMCAEIDSHLELIIFSGTDDTIIGWKENLNMLISKTPGQQSSCEYLRKVMDKNKKYIICGHSKGGNLSIFSTLHIEKEYQDLIIGTFSFDGPGLTENFDDIPNFNESIKKIVNVIPQTSVIGMLFEHPEKQLVVHSNEKGIFQHDVFSWEVMGKKIVVEEKGLSNDAIHIDKKIKDIISTMDDPTKVKFCDILYHILGGSDIPTLTELNKKRSVILKNYFNTDLATKHMFNKILSELLLDKVIAKTLLINLAKFNKFKDSVLKE